MLLVVRPKAADALEKLPEDGAAAVRAALGEIPAAFGRPHLHSGLGIRQLRPGTYEARAGRHLRAVFNREGDTLVVELLGNHNDVQRYLRNLR